MATKLTGTKRKSYTVSDNLQFVNCTKQHESRAAERQLGVSEVAFICGERAKKT